MGAKYTTILSGGEVSTYNDSPPADNGAATAANRVKYATITSDLTAPLHSAITRMDDKLVALADEGPDVYTTTYTTLASDFAKVLECSGTFTLSLLAPATNAGYRTTIKNNATGTVTVNVDGGAQIEGASSFAVEQGQAVRFRVNNAATAYYVENLSPYGASPPLIQGQFTYWVPASAMTPRFSNGCQNLVTYETTANRPDIVTLDFDDTVDEFAQFFIAMPHNWDEGNITYKPYWTHKTSGAAFGAAWFLQGVAVANAGTLDVAFGTAQSSVDTGGTNEVLYIGAESSALTVAGSPAAGELSCFQVYRDISDAGDTLVADACLKGVMLFYTVDAGDES